MSRKRKSILARRWTIDTVATPCPCCGTPVHKFWSGPFVALPRAHECAAQNAMEAQRRTIRAEESAGLRVTEGEAARRLNRALYGTRDEP